MHKVGKEVATVRDQLDLIHFITSNQHRVVLFPKVKINQKLEYTNEIIECINSSEFNEIHPLCSLTVKAQYLCLKLSQDLTTIKHSLKELEAVINKQLALYKDQRNEFSNKFEDENIDEIRKHKEEIRILERKNKNHSTVKIATSVGIIAALLIFASVG